MAPLVELLESNFLTRSAVGVAGKDDFRYEQGVVAELRTVLGLEQSAKQLSKPRKSRRSSGF